MLATLLRKDWRLNRPVVIGSVAMSVVPYVVALLLQWIYPPHRGNTQTTYLEVGVMTAMFCLAITVVMASAYGGVAFAAERRDRTAEFLALLPVRRSQIVVSKLAVAFACVAAMWTFHTAIIGVCGYLVAPTGDHRAAFGDVFDDAFTICIPVILLSFGIAWLMSSFLQGPSLAAGLSLGATALILFVTCVVTAKAVDTWSALEDRTTLDNSPYVRSAVQSVGVGVGVLSVCVGAGVYVRRVRP